MSSAHMYSSSRATLAAPRRSASNAKKPSHPPMSRTVLPRRSGSAIASSSWASCSFDLPPGVITPLPRSIECHQKPTLSTRRRARTRSSMLLLLDDPAQPVDRLADAVADADLRLPAEQALGLLDARPAANDVDLERRLVLERERVRVAAGLLPDDAGELGDGELVARADVEVLVDGVRRGHRGDDAVGDVVDVGQRAGVRAVAEDRQRGVRRQREALADQVGHGVGDAGFVLGNLAGAVGVERAADR